MRPLAVVLPVFDEGSTPAELVARMPDVVDRVFVIDDGSSDDGPDIAERAGARASAKSWHHHFNPLCRNSWIHYCVP